MEKRLFTSECVTNGHPDKVADSISDAILDACLQQDPGSRVACETCATTGMVMVMGEITTSCYVDIPKIVRDVVREIGYDRAKYGFDCDTCAVITSIDEQSPDIAMGVDVLVIWSVAPEAMAGVIDQAMAAGIKVIAFVAQTEKFDVVMLSDDAELASSCAKLAAIESLLAK